TAGSGSHTGGSSSIDGPDGRGGGEGAYDDAAVTGAKERGPPTAPAETGSDGSRGGRSRGEAEASAGAWPATACGGGASAGGGGGGATHENRDPRALPAVRAWASRIIRT